MGLFTTARNTFKHLNLVLRIVAASFAYGLLDKAWTMSEAGEYLAALIMLVLAVVFAAVAVYGWSGIPKEPGATKVLKSVLLAAVGLWSVYSFVVIWRKRGDKPWTNITWSDLTKARTYVSYLSIVNPRTWGTLAFGVGVGVLLVTAFRWRPTKRLMCPAPRLHDLEEKDQASIKDLIRVTGIHYRPEFDKGSPYIDFTFGIFNISLYDIVIENSIKNGNILFGEDNEKFFYEPRIEAKRPILCRSRSANYFVVRQAVRAEEITRFKGANDLLLAFHSLEIVFQGTEQFPEIKSTPLNTHHYLETKKGMWRALDELESVFAFTDEQWALLSETKHEATAVLKAEINSLRSQLEEAKENATTTLPQPIEVAAEPNLVFAPDDKPISVRRDLDGILVEGDYGSDLMVWTVRCKNERQCRPVRKVGGINNVYAEISFRGYGDGYFSIPADRAAWLSERNERVGFPVGVSHRLVIATQRNDKLSGVQRRNSTLGGVVNETPLIGDLFRVLISLFANSESDAIAKFDLMLDLKSPYMMVATSLWKHSHLLDRLLSGYKLDERHRKEGDSEELEEGIAKWQTEVARFLGAHYSDGDRAQFEGKPIGPIVPGAPRRFTLGLPEPKTIYEKLSAQIKVLDRLSK
jgi:uncharacterized membrane protein YiaA